MSIVQLHDRFSETIRHSQQAVLLSLLSRAQIVRMDQLHNGIEVELQVASELVSVQFLGSKQGTHTGTVLRESVDFFALDASCKHVLGIPQNFTLEMYVCDTDTGLWTEVTTAVSDSAVVAHGATSSTVLSSAYIVIV
jgi:hypothetical protein